jgi:hypothetical protein
MGLPIQVGDAEPPRTTLTQLHAKAAQQKKTRVAAAA